MDSIVNSSDVFAAKATAAIDFIGCTAIGISNIRPVAMLEMPDSTNVLRMERPYLRVRAGRGHRFANWSRAVRDDRVQCETLTHPHTRRGTGHASP